MHESRCITLECLIFQNFSFSFHRLLVLSTEAMKQEEVCPDPVRLREHGPLTAFLQYGWHLAYFNGELTLGTFLKHHIAQLDSVKVRIHCRFYLHNKNVCTILTQYNCCSHDSIHTD